MGPAILIAAAVGIVVLGGIGWFVVKRINDGPQEKHVSVDASKIKEWQTAIQTHDPEKAADQAFESSSDAYAALKALRADISRRIGPPVQAVHVCGSFDEYKNFDLAAWASENLDLDDVNMYLSQLERLGGIFAEIRDDLDRACVMTCDELDERTKQACWRIVDDILDMFPGGLDVKYSFTDPVNRRAYHNTVLLEQSKLRRMAGRGSDPRDDLDGGVLPRLRHERLKTAGYRCARCGRSPLTGAVVRVWLDDNGEHPECLCERCRRI